jgi:hypothetical protein
MARLRQKNPIDERLAVVVSHPLRARAFMVLAERTASPSDVARILKCELNDVAYHIRKLHKLDVIELVDEQPVRGAVEHFYRAIERPLVWKEEYGTLDQGERNDFAREINQFLFADVAAAIASGIFSSRSDNCVARTPMLIDSKGWSEVSDIMEKALKDVIQVQASSAERMVESGEDGIHAEAGLLFFERQMAR